MLRAPADDGARSAVPEGPGTAPRPDAAPDGGAARPLGPGIRGRARGALLGGVVVNGDVPDAAGVHRHAAVNATADGIVRFALIHVDPLPHSRDSLGERKGRRFSGEVGNRPRYDRDHNGLPAETSLRSAFAKFSL
ncbi:hypothetical protein GCM10009602_33650 [Nocardiopsis tropica]